MANQYGLFWNSVSGDRTYNADSFAEWANTFFSTGVFNGDLQVTPDSGMVVNVGTGYANINGKVRLFDAQTTFTLSPASGTYPRIDTIVVRRNDTARTITLEYVMGAYSGLDPQPTAPTRDETTYEIVLAQILVNAGATSISVGDITDTRPDDTICGWITGSVDSVDVDQLTAQARAQFDEWFQEMKDQLSEDAAGHLQLEIDDINDSITGINNEIGTTDISGIGDGTVTGAVSALNNGLWDWETFQGTVGGVAQTFYRKRLGNVYIIFGAGSVNVPIGAGTTSQRQIVFSSKAFTQAIGGAANLAVAGQVDSYARYVNIGRDRVDAWVYNSSAATVNTLMYSFIVIGV